jgi:hypothetical protein
MSEATEEAHMIDPAPPAGDEIHMPESSIIPLVNSAALAAAIVCITLSWWLVAVFTFVFLVSTVRWAMDTKREIAALPLDSHH